MTRASQTTAATRTTFPAWPVFDEEMIDAAARVLRSGQVNYWTGEEGRQFETEFAQSVGVQHAVAVANGTVALELALHALGIGAGDEVIVPARTFIATASAVAARGAVPVCADVDRQSQNITPDTIRPCLTGRTRAIIAVHLAGWPCDVPAIVRMARPLDIAVVEDCAQAHGARLGDRKVGSLGDVAAFSFCQDKIMTTAGEGGMLTTNRTDLWQRAWSYKDHGKNHDAAYAPTTAPGFRWLHESFGTNWRMTEVQAAVGRVALELLPLWLNARRRNAALLAKRLEGLDALRVPMPGEQCRHAWYKFYAFLDPQALRPDWSRERILKEISAAGVPCGTGSCSEIYLEKAFAEELRPARRRAVARELGETSLMLPVHPTLEVRHMARIGEVVGDVVERATAPGQASRSA